MRCVRAVPLSCLAWLLCVPALAQQSAPPAASVRPAAAAPPLTAGRAFIASALLPGSAQYLAGDERWVPYVAGELWSLVSYIQQRRSANRLAARYRELAWQVPRRTDRIGARRDSVFEYYEAMADYSSSGRFDADPNTPDVQPENEIGTFNGDVWLLARDLHFPLGRQFAPGTPQYEAALAYYKRHAIAPGYGWAWGASNLEQQVFGDLIHQSDVASRNATRYLGFIVANHIVSAVDALVTARLRELGAGSVRIEGEFIPDARGARLEQVVRIRF